uniref:Uncharacterized protein n=1 Tax=Glossina morsitans morsitans TaxID=37546 RepID=A0A1B0FJ21_GLOMM
MRLLMYSEVELQKTSNFASTSLHLARSPGIMACARLLCEKSNLDLEPRDKNGKTPIMLAQTHHHQDIARVLYNEVKKKPDGCLPYPKYGVGYLVELAIQKKPFRHTMGIEYVFGIVGIAVVKLSMV